MGRDGTGFDEMGLQELHEVYEAAGWFGLGRRGYEDVVAARRDIQKVVYL